MTNSPTSSVPNTTSRVNHFTGLARKRRRFSLLPANGDGSTLSLDFTTGILDQRLTFTRTTNATFINSQGLVEWANSNMYWNTAFEGLSGSNPSLTSSGWGYALSTGGTAVFNGDGSVTVTTTAAERRAIFRSSGFSGGGLRVVASVDVTIASGSLQASQVIVTGTPTNAQHYVNGVAWNSLHPLWNGGILPVGTQFNIAYATDSLTSGTTSMYFGVGCSSVIAGSATFSNPRWTMWKGSGTVPYYPNTSATNNSTANYFKSNDYQAPRFDYDPTAIGTTRGLLIEGSGNNLATNSVAMWNWGTSGPTRTPDTTTTDIFGVTGSSSITTKVVKASGTGPQYTTLSFGIPQVTVPANASVDVTFSVWIRMDGANQPKCSLGILDTSGTPSFGATFGTKSPGGQSVSNSSVTMSSYSSAECDYTFGSVTGWVRCSVSRRLNNTTASPINWTTGLVLIYPDRFTSNAATIYVCGGQIELGIGPSSWIPTGASTGSRAFDSCVMEDITSCNYSAKAGTLFYAGRFTQMNAASFPNRFGFTRETGDLRAFYALSTTTALLPGYSNGATSVLTTQNITLNSELKLAISFDADLSTAEVKSSLNGAAIVQSGASALTESNAPTYFMIGQKGYGAFFPHGTVRSVKYWPTVLPTAQLQSMTT